MRRQVKIGIAGASGYVGKALMQLVLGHPHLRLAGLLIKSVDASTEARTEFGCVKNIPVYTLEELLEHPELFDLLCLTTPAETSIEIVRALQGSINIIDLSGAFRLPQSLLMQWYGVCHDIPSLIAGAPYGLSPFYQPDTMPRVLANPGCYATCALLSLIPLLKQGLIQANNIIIDAKSGVSGAGKKPSAHLMFCEMSENYFPYKVGKHQHIPEIKQALLKYTKQDCEITFVTSLLPIKSGIAMSIYADLSMDFESDQKMLEAIAAAYQASYADYPFLTVGQINRGDPDYDAYLLALKNVIGTPNTHIAYTGVNKKILLFSTMDNLLKGAAAQAIENINRLYGWAIEIGLCPKKGIDNVGDSV